MNTSRLREIVENRISEHETFRKKTRAKIDAGVNNEDKGLLSVALMCSSSETDFLATLLKEMTDG